MASIVVAPAPSYFISRSGANAEWGLWVADVVRAAGFDYFLQEHDLPLGADVDHEIDAAFDRCEHVIALLSPDYIKSPNCMREFNAARSSDPVGEKRRVLIFRIADCEIPATSRQIVHLDLRDRSHHSRRKVHARLTGERVSYRDSELRTFTGNLPVVDPHLFGRDRELAVLDAAWADPQANVVAVVAGGGTGKTALVDHWFRLHVEEATVFGWSFYSQGSIEDRQTPSDPFFNEAMRFFDVKVGADLSVFAKAEALARRLRDERVLLILDGMEPLQAPDGGLRDNAMKALLNELRTRNRGLAVCTSRLPLVDVPADEHRSIAMDLDNLDPVSGGQYLRHLRVKGPDGELQDASKEFGNHALALTLLGTYLVEYLDGDVRRRVDIPALVDPDSKPGEHARRMMTRYAKMFEGKPERHVLTALGYFDRPAEPEALKLVLPKMTDKEYRGALNRLKTARLILDADPTRPLDCHPLIREHFASEATEEGHGRLYEHYCKLAPQRPETLEQMKPLFHAVLHGCRAGRHQKVLNDVYRDRILRGDEFHLTTKLGAFVTNLSLVANFFRSPWTQPDPSLSAADQSWLTSQAAFAFRAVGRLADSVTPMSTGATAAVGLADWKKAANDYSNLSGLQLTIGNVTDALVAASQSLEYADRSGDASWRMVSLTTRADALHAAGEIPEANRLFKEAEHLRLESPPEYSHRGYRYYDFLLALGRSEEVHRRATRSLAVALGSNWLHRIGLNHLCLGRATGSRTHLDQAVDYIRRAGTLHNLPLALLARGDQADLDEVYTLATRCGMRLHLTDYHLTQARLHIANGKPTNAQPHFDAAAQLIADTGYHRRDGELAELRTRLSSSSSPAG